MFNKNTDFRGKLLKYKNMILNEHVSKFTSQ